MKNRLFFGAGVLAFTAMTSWVLVPEQAVYEDMQTQSVDDQQKVLQENGSMEEGSPDSTHQSFETSEVVFPVEEYVTRRTYKGFGEYIDDGRFVGYHVAEDIEFVDATNIDIPVVAITDGVVTYKEDVAGYGGLIKVKHNIDGQHMTALYGHVDLTSSSVKVGDQLKTGQFLAHLGEHKSQETDGRRKHLHFGLYVGDDDRVRGYEKNATDVERWLNPSDVFASSGLVVDDGERAFRETAQFGRVEFPLSFSIPAGHDIEFFPATNTLNMYRMQGDGVAHERSSVNVQYVNTDPVMLDDIEMSPMEEGVVVEGHPAAMWYEGKRMFEDGRSGAHQPTWLQKTHAIAVLPRMEGDGWLVISVHPDIDQGVRKTLLDSIVTQ